MTNTNLSTHFSELQRSFIAGDYDKALKAVDKILKEDPNHLKALHSKAVCLIRNNAFQDALTVISGPLSDVKGVDVSFEKAYCLYRLNRVDEALTTLRSIKNQDLRVKELLAQALYRVEQYEESFSVYRELIKNSSDEYEVERETNLSAVLASLSLSKGIPPSADIESSIDSLGDQMYELCYNKACIEVGREDYQKALELLTKAEEECISSMREDDATEEEIEAEAGIIRAQQGYVYQLLKKDQVALSLYNQVLKAKPDDSSLLAVVSNNVVTINKDQNVFDSKKKIKTALSEDAKLTSLQKKAILVNNALFLLLTSQYESCRKQIKEIKALGGAHSNFEGVLLEAALLVREKKISDAINVLKTAVNEIDTESDDDSVLQVPFVLCQLLLSSGRVSETIKILTSLPGNQSKRLGILSTITSLYVSLENREGIIQVLKDAISWYQKTLKNSVGNEEDINKSLMILYREASKYLIEANQPKQAVELLEQQRKLTPKNPNVIAQLIAAYSQFDPKKAAEVTKSLPPIDSAIEGVDITTLESSNWSLGAKYVKRTAKLGDPSPGMKDGQTVGEKKKKKRKRKKILPKRYDPTVDPDPERWLPRWQRSTYKKKKDRRQKDAIGKGTQGAVGGAETETITKAATASTAKQGPTSPPSAGGSARPKGAKAGGGKKKGGRR